MKKKQGHIQNQNISEKTDRSNVKRMDIYFADLSTDGIGSEQLGMRPVLVIQNDIGNQFSPTLIVASITAKSSKAKLPTHVEINAKEHGLEKNSVLLLEQLRTIDKKRLIRKITHLEGQIVEDVHKALMISLGLIKF